MSELKRPPIKTDLGAVWEKDPSVKVEEKIEKMF